MLSPPDLPPQGEKYDASATRPFGSPLPRPARKSPLQHPLGRGRGVGGEGAALSHRWSLSRLPPLAPLTPGPSPPPLSSPAVSSGCGRGERGVRAAYL